MQVKNDGNLAVKYDMLLTVTNETNDTYKLTDVLEYAIIDGMTSEMYTNLYVNTGNTDWENISNANGVQVGAVPEGKVPAATNGKLLAGESDYILLAVHMDEDASNNYQDKDVTIDVQIEATQLPYEEDSFGSNYDAGASAEKEEEEDGPQVKYTNLLLNSSFEEASGTSPNAWLTDGSTIAVKTGGAPDGEKYLSLSSKENIYVAQSVAVEPGKKYTLSGMLKRVTDTGRPVIKIQHFGADGKSKYSYDFEKRYSSSEVGVWSEFTIDLNIPDDVAKIEVLVRLVYWDGDATSPVGEVCWDNVQLIGETVATSNNAALLAQEFRAMLAEEKENSQMVVKDSTFDAWEEKEPLPGQSNVVVNADFEDGLNGWARDDDPESTVSLAVGEGIDGSNAIKFSATSAQSPGNPCYIQTLEPVAGAEYQVIYWYKIEEGAKTQPLVKIESLGDTINEVVTGYKGYNIQPKGNEYIRDGNWHRVAKKIVLPISSKVMNVYPRMLTPNNEDQTVLIDGIQIYMTATPEIMIMETDQTFYYEDKTTATFKAGADVKYFPDLATAKLKFQVYDGTSLVGEKEATAVDGIATVEWSLKGFRKEVPYCVKAFMYDSDGNEVGVASKNIYIYPRAEYLAADGTYMKNGTEPFLPLFGEHVKIEQYEKVKEAGINLVQLEHFATPEEALVYLDACEGAGLMGYIPLYRNMIPGGSNANIENTVNVLSDARVVNHPALFGYVAMDEPYLHFEDPYEDLVNTFRLVRMLDSKHPVISVGATESNFNELGQTVDILMIDLYCNAAWKGNYKNLLLAKEAVYGEKPIYEICETYRTAFGRLNTPEDGRNNNWQALLGGADGLGYYSIRDAERDENGKAKIPLWDANDGGALWNALVEWNEKEKEIAFDHFMDKDSTAFNQDIDVTEDFWYYSWKADDALYMLVLGVKDGQSLDVSIPLTSTDGTETIGAYTAEVIAGDELDTSGTGNLELTVDGVQAVLYKIIPNN